MSRKNLNFGDKNIQKSGFYKNENVTRIDDIDANKILVSRTIWYKIFIQILYRIQWQCVIRPLWMKLPQVIDYVRKSEGNTIMFFKISDKQLLKSTIKYGKELKNYWKKNLTVNLFMVIIMLVAGIQIFRAKICQKKKHHASVYQ